MRLKALVTGANGMLADALWPLLDKNGYVVHPCDLAANDTIFRVDIRNFSEVMDFARARRPDIIFHLAAETDVDKCQLNREHAFETNTKGTENMAVICKELDLPLVYVSTGAVFDGEKMTGYTEEDAANPTNIYGESKLRGEEAVCSMLTKYYIVRASWMVGGQNKDKKFVWKIAQLLRTKKEIPVVTDKYGSPTFTRDFAKGLLDIVSNGKYGLYHCVSKGICSRFDIAKKIAEYLGKRDVILKPVTSEAFPLPAPRGKSEGLLNSRLRTMDLDKSRPWQDALKEYIEEIK